MAILRSIRLNGKSYVVTLPAGPAGNDDLGVFLGVLGVQAEGPASAYTTALSATSGLVGSPVTMTFAPVGGPWPPGTVISPTDTGVAGTFSPSAINASGAGPVTCTFTPAAAGTASLSSTVSPALTNTTGALTYSAAAVGGAAQTLTVTNWAAAASQGFHKQGVWFRKGDMPSGRFPALGTGTAQFYALRRWSDGSLKTARLLLRDAAFTASETRSYAMSPVTASVPAGSTAAAGNSGLAAALTGHDIKVAFSSVLQNDQFTTATHGSGAFTASLATHAATATRWTLLTTGPVADVWQGWGMATDNTGGAADPHLKVNWYVTRWKNADGSTAGLQVGAVVALDWCSVAAKYELDYDASLMDGATTIVSYTGVKHPYQSQWILAVQSGNNIGAAPWIGGAQPTLYAPPDKAYLISTGLVPPLHKTATPVAMAVPAYTPCGNMEHRAAIDGTGEYLGRGLLPATDADAFMRGDAQAYARARVNALAGLGVPYHFRSNRTRTRPGETTADTANTVVSLKMAPKAASYYDFTADGMPIAVDAYFDDRTPVANRDGYVYPTGYYDAGGAPTYRGRGVWGTSGDASHAVSYSYYMALISGDEWLLESTLDLATNLAHQGIYGWHNNRQLMHVGAPQTASRNPPPPQDYYTGLLGQWQTDNVRSMGWAQLILGHACSLIPADHVAYRYFQAALSHNGDYIAGSLDIVPADYLLCGSYYPDSMIVGSCSPWQGAIQATCSFMNYIMNEDARWLRLGNFTATWAIRQGNAGRYYMMDAYRVMDRMKSGAWDANANTLLPAEQQGFLSLTVNLDAPSGVFTVPGVYWNAVNQPPPPFSNGDKVTFTQVTQNSTSGALPAGATDGQIAYIINVTNPSGTPGSGTATNPTTFQLSATPGGAPLTWTTSMTGLNLTWRPQSASNYPVATSSLYMPVWQNYIPMSMAVIQMAKQAGSTAVTQALVDNSLAFLAPMRPSTYSAYDLIAT